MTDNWKEARLDRLTERIDRIEQERWDEKQRVFERRSRIFLAILWLEVIALVAITVVAAATS